MMRDPESTLGHLIDHCKHAVISSVDSEGYPNTKMMLAPRLRDGIRQFYFTTNTSSHAVESYRRNPKGCVYFFDARFFRGVMFMGKMEVLEDADHKQLIWREGDNSYYPGGVTDPDYCVLRFTVTRGRYYANFKTESFALQ